MREEIDRRVVAEDGTDRVVVIDTPLLNVRPGRDFGAIIVVDVPIEVAVERLVSFRAMDETDARARITKQITRDERVAQADRVIDNGGDLAHLEAQMDDLWSWLHTLPASVPPVAAETDA